jgi:glutathione S-transferase
MEKMNTALAASQWLAGDTFSMADIALAPYVNRLAVLSMQGLWTRGRLPELEDWFRRVQARPAFAPAFLRYMPEALAAEMGQNGNNAWPEVAQLLAL